MHPSPTTQTSYDSPYEVFAEVMSANTWVYRTRKQVNTELQVCYYFSVTSAEESILQTHLDNSIYFKIT